MDEDGNIVNNGGHAGKPEQAAEQRPREAVYPDTLRAGRNASCACGRVHETPLAKLADPGHPKGQPMRKRRAQGQQAAASGVFLWVFLRI